MRFGCAVGIVLCVILAAAGFGVPQAPQQTAPITISAAISLKDALDEIGRAYEDSHSGARVTFNYGGSGTLQHQIEQGAPVDIFFPAAEKQMDALESEGLILAGTRRDVATNVLVLIAPTDSGLPKDFQDLARPEIKVVALGEPATVPAGLYAQETLDHLGLLAAVKTKAVYAKDVRQVLTYVETGNADAGIVYQTDARISSQVRVVATAPADSHEPIVYPVAIIKGSRNIPSAQAFLDYIAGPEARAIFVKHGFGLPEK